MAFQDIAMHCVLLEDPLMPLKRPRNFLHALEWLTPYEQLIYEGVRVAGKGLLCTPDFQEHPFNHHPELNEEWRYLPIKLSPVLDALVADALSAKCGQLPLNGELQIVRAVKQIGADKYRWESTAYLRSPHEPEIVVQENKAIRGGAALDDAEFLKRPGATLTVRSFGAITASAQTLANYYPNGKKSETVPRHDLPCIRLENAAKYINVVMSGRQALKERR